MAKGKGYLSLLAAKATEKLDTSITSSDSAINQVREENSVANPMIAAYTPIIRTNSDPNTHQQLKQEIINGVVDIKSEEKGESQSEIMTNTPKTIKATSVNDSETENVKFDLELLKELNFDIDDVRAKVPTVLYGSNHKKIKVLASALNKDSSLVLNNIILYFFRTNQKEMKKLIKKMNENIFE